MIATIMFIVMVSCYYSGMEEETRLAMQDQLVDVIMWVLVSHPELHYYQGYHDIVVTFLLVLGERLTFGVMDKLSKQHLRFVNWVLFYYVFKITYENVLVQFYDIISVKSRME